MGFIVSLRESWESYNAIKEANLPNVLLQAFVPQKELLNDDRIQAILTHCGANSLMEAIYYGKPIIGMPLGWDQYGLCYRASHILGIGQSLGDSPKADQIVQSFKELVPLNDSSIESSERKRVK